MDVRFADRELKCFDCGGVFVFTAGEQVFFSDKQFRNDPKRCKPCKSKRTGVPGAPVPGAKLATGVRMETRTECSTCGLQTTVPFRPTQGRPVLCRECFQAKGRGEAAPRMVGAANSVHLGSAVRAGDLTTEEAVQVSSAILHAPAHSSVSTQAEMASIASVWPDAVQPLMVERAVAPKPTASASASREESMVEETAGMLA